MSEMHNLRRISSGGQWKWNVAIFEKITILLEKRSLLCFVFNIYGISANSIEIECTFSINFKWCLITIRVVIIILFALSLQSCLSIFTQSKQEKKNENEIINQSQCGDWTFQFEWQGFIIPRAGCKFRFSLWYAMKPSNPAPHKKFRKQLFLSIFMNSFAKQTRTN